MSAEGFEVLRQHMLAEICAGIFLVSGLIGKAALEGMSRLFVEHCEAVAAKINITRRWLGEQ